MSEREWRELVERERRAGRCDRLAKLRAALEWNRRHPERLRDAKGRLVARRALGRP